MFGDGIVQVDLRRKGVVGFAWAKQGMTGRWHRVARICVGIVQYRAETRRRCFEWTGFGVERLGGDSYVR